MEKKYCNTCKFWERIQDSDYQKDMGNCHFLSGKRRETTSEDDVYPSVEMTGIESTPISYHDGIGFEYETKSWFGCIHHSNQLLV